MTNPRPGNVVKRSLAVGTLTLLAATQVVSLVLRASQTERPATVAVGEDLSPVTIWQPGGSLPLGSGRPTLLLAFHVDCAHSRRIAPDWSAWLSATRLDDVSVVAVTTGPLPEAASHAQEAGWPVEVGSVEPDGSTRGDALTQRSPWVFAVDGAGQVVAEGHGSKIREVARALGVGAPESPPS